MNNYQDSACKEAYEDGYSDGLRVNVSIVNPVTDEYIALFYDSEEIDLDTLNAAFDKLSEKMPTENIIALPKSTCLTSCDKKFLEQYIGLIKKAIQELEDK